MSKIQDQQMILQSENDRLLDRSEQLQNENNTLCERIEQLESQRLSGNADAVVMPCCECI